MSTIIEFPNWRVSELYGHIGKITVKWACLDFAVRGAVAAVHSLPEAKVIEAEPPRAMSRRIRFLRRATRRIAALSPFNDKMQQLTSSITTMSGIRDGLAHGYPALYEVEAGTIAFMRLDSDSESHISEELRLTMREIIDAGTTIEWLHHDFAGLVHEILDSGVV